MGSRHGYQCARRLSGRARGGARHDCGRSAGQHHQHRVHPWPSAGRTAWPLCHFKGRYGADDQGHGAGMGALRYPRERPVPRLHRNALE